MKAIIEVGKPGSAFLAVRQQLSQAQQGLPIDYKLFFESAQSLFTQLTPTRLDLLNTLSRLGVCSMEALAKNNISLENDIEKLEELGLVEKNAKGDIFVPFETVEILFPLAKAA